MKSVKSIQLFFQEGNSDKVYEIDLLETAADAYVVNFRYGRRGAVLKEGTKTVFPVSLNDAEKIFAELESEKRKKGYTAQGENPNFIPDISPVKSEGATTRRNKAILKLLKAAANDEEHETWPLSRIIWRTGELQITEAAPLIIKLADKKDNLQLYSCIWALGRIGNSAATVFLSELLQQKYPSHIINLAQAALLNVSDEATEKNQIESLKLTLPDSLKHAINSEDMHLHVFLKDLFTKFGSASNEFLVTFYLVSVKDERLRNAFINGIKLAPLKPGYFKYIRQIFKISEMLNDTEVYGLLAKSIEKANYNFSSSHEYVNGKWTSVAEELKKENSSLAFSKKTKEYFARRIMRTLEKLGKDKSPLFTKYATDILLMFDDELDLKQPEKNSRYTYDYNSTTRTYTTLEHITWFDSYSTYRALYYILYANSTRYKLPKSKNRWQCVPPYTPGTPFQPLREEAFAVLWNQAPEDTIKLLANSRCERVSDFALFVFQNNAAFKEKITEENLLSFINNRSLKIQQLGFDIVKEKYSDKAPPTGLLVALLLCHIEEARAYSQKWIDKDPVKFANDPDLISIILLSKNYDSHNWLQGFLLQNKPVAEVLTEVLNTIIENIQQGGLIEEEAHIISLTRILESNFKEAIAKLDQAIIFALLLHPIPAIQGLAGKLLVLKKPDPSQVPDTIIFSLLQSENIQARTAAIDLLNNMDAKVLAEKQSLVLSLCLSPLQDIRQSAQKLVDKLLSVDSSSGYGLVNLFLPVLTVQEKYEGLHQDILKLISGKLSAYLDKIEPKKILSLCVSRYTASQELGNMLLEKYIQLSTLSIKELNQIANSNLLKNRQYILNYYSSNVNRARTEKKDAIMLADSIWEDVRKFAFDYFKSNFLEQDWEPELFIALCDSVKLDVQAYGREMITKWFEEDNGFDYLLKLSQHPDSRMQLFASGFLDQYAGNNYEMLKKLNDFFMMLLSQVNKGHTAKMRSINLLSREAIANEQNAVLIATIFNRMSATASIQDKALYIKALLDIRKKFPLVDVVLKVKETPVYKQKQNSDAVQL